MSDRYYVVDTNTLISAALFEASIPGKALQRCLASGTLLQSLDTLQELSEVLARPRFDRYVSPEEREEFLAALVNRAELIHVREQISVCRDPKDDKFLALAVDGRADCIVTGDSDLLELHPFRGIPIKTARQFLEE